MERNANAYYELLNATVELFNERIQEDELTEDGEYQDALHEVVDGQVPHYYHEVFTVMAADGLDPEFEDSGLIPETKDVTRICQARIYEQLIIDVPQQMDIVWWEQPEDDEESAPAVWFVMSDAVKEGSRILSTHYDFESAIKRCKDLFYDEQGLPCHVEDDTSDVWVFTPEGHPEEETEGSAR
ncbi:protein Ocr [Kosakonia phage Kc166A]|uniref:Protein Ocr n=1 Tax=Kosakonia phage Kc166A TaxID=2801381 RepID=A0AAE7RHB1_9CAUD|nr:protein Ocr [Kosakonia phage Kc166A]